MRKILITEPFRNSDIEKIKEAAGEEFLINQIVEDWDSEEVKKELADAEVVIGQPPMSFLANKANTCPRLKFIQMTWAGTDMYTLSDTKFPEGEILLANASGTFGMVMSQYVIGMILSVMLDFKGYNKQQEERVWKRRGPVKSLDHARVMIFGAGDIGTSVAKRLTGFDAYCIGVCRDTKRERDYFDKLITLDEVQDYLKDIDVVVGCIPNNSDTKEFMNFERLSAMKEGSIIVNVGRGNFIDCIALNELLDKGHLWGAALDVTNPEPLPIEHPLWNNPKCMITPHSSGASFGMLEDTIDLLCDIVCDNISRYKNCEEIRNRIY